MRRNVCGGILVLALLAGLAGTSSAQETGTPVFKAPYRAFTSHEFGHGCLAHANHTHDEDDHVSSIFRAKKKSPGDQARALFASR